MRKKFKKRFCNYCKRELDPPDRSRFYTGKIKFNVWVAQYDLGKDKTITFVTKKGKIMDFCDKNHKHYFYYGRKVPLSCKNPKEYQEELLAKRKLKKKNGLFSRVFGINFDFFK